MSTTRIIVVALAIGAAVMAALLAKSFIGSAPQKEVVEVNKFETSKVLVAQSKLKMGDSLKPGSVSWSDWPTEKIQPYMITQDARPDALEFFAKARARSDIFDGEPINMEKLVTPDSAGFMAALLPKGMRAVSVRVSPATGAGGFILPNDRVDILLTNKTAMETNGENGTNTTPVLQNVRVLAIDQLFTETEQGEKTVIGNTATLELEPYMAEILTMAENMGQITLALRSLSDNGESELGDAGPRLAGEYAENGASGTSKVTIFRHGVPSIVSGTK